MIVSLKNIINKTLLDASLLNESLTETQINDIEACRNFIKDRDTGNIYFAVENLQSGIVEEKHVDQYIDYNINFLRGNKHILNNVVINPAHVCQIDEDIEYLISHEITPKTYTLYNEAYDRLRQHLLSNKENLSESHIYKMYEEKLNQLPPSTIAILEELSEIEDKATYFQETQQNILTMLKEELLKAGDSDQKVLIYEAREKICSLTYNDSDYVDNFVCMKNVHEALID